MKKLMIVAAIAMAAVASQAAQFNWQTSGKFCDKAGTVLANFATGTEIVLVYLGNGAGASWEGVTADDIASHGTVKTGTNKGKVGGTVTFTYGAEGSYVNGDTFGMMFLDDKGNLSQLLKVADSTPIATTYVIDGLGSDSWSGTTFTPTTEKFYAASVPEPTSGLLLLLGVAGMALRRRRA